MRLSRLHIAGFKSFPDRAELGFDQGVTAIVGPNGCGKSNVVDAITWVLGEQSAKSLRGDRMEDVIFNGSDARKPTATAEVRLKLTEVAQAAMAAQATFDELLDGPPVVALTRDVEIGRRLYRSGESEYLIDGEVCRLRDVHDLLMDSGLGVKAYAVIEQGKIGQILASRPAERRMLIEEAAGVTKYKSRRRSAELKLEAAEQNLTRVDDIVFEVEKQRGALKRQAARARRYKRLREELRRWEQVQFAHRHETLSREIAAAEAHLAEARAREAAAGAQLAAIEAALETLRLGLTQAEARATETREQAHLRELEIGRREQQIRFDKQQTEDLAVQADAASGEMRELEARRVPGRMALDMQVAAAQRAREALDGIGTRVAALQADYGRALEAVQVVEQESDTTRAAVMAAVTTLSALRQARDHATAMRDRIAADRERLEIEARDLSAEADRVRAEQETASRALDAGRLSLDEAGQQRARIEAELRGFRADRERVRGFGATRERELAAKGARLRSLEELEASRATFGDAARFLLAESAGALRQHGALADHLRVERSFERAVDALLGDLLQHVLVDRMEDVVTGRALLSERDAGRCGFIVLDEAHASETSDPRQDAPVGVRTLGSVVTTTGPYAAVLDRLLGHALVVDSYEAARALAQTVSIPVATTAGEVFRGAWRVEAGSRQDVRGILETRAEVLTLRDDVRAAAAEIEASGQELIALDETIGRLSDALDEAVKAQHLHEKTIVAIESGVARTSESLARVSRRLDVVSTERGRADDEEATTARRRDEAAEAIDAHELEQGLIEGRLGDVLARLQAARDFGEARLGRVTDARAEQAVLTERASALDNEVARLEEAARDLEARIAGRLSEIQRTETRREELRASIASHEQALDEDARLLDRLKGGMRALDEEVVLLRQQFSVRDQEIRSARHVLEAIRTEVMHSEVTRATASADLTHLAAACVEAVGSPIDVVVVEVARMEAAGELQAPAHRVAEAAAPDEDEDARDDDRSVSTSQAEAESVEVRPAEADIDEPPLTPEQVIADLRKKIDRLGPVNMMAIEQFDDLEARHAFLTTQRKDLLDAIAQTGEAIRKIDKTTRERFTEAFALINTNFEKTFTTLFGGGRAGLVLIDQEDDSESGIDIIAQPPGKRLQNVQLLSGGEKALTAMALMFAIFRYRPSPFCLLDEIDAPLDDANIGRFVEMLQGMQEHTQFILITHNRKTMEIADRLYGVTMEEPGVSKLISVQLN
jgi:chromosome segregation protein